MRSVYEARVAEATEIQRQIRQGADRIVSSNFGRIAKVLWPLKTAYQLAAISGRDERTTARWLSGEIEPPYCIVEATMHEIFKRD
jgi:hypothetical protein